jgi:hypothetical protein
VALRVPVDLVLVAVSAEPFTLQTIVHFPHHIEWPIAHLARVPDNVVSGEVNSDTDEDCSTVRFRCPAGDGRDDCRHHQSYKSRRDKLHGTPHGVDGAIPHSLKIVSEYIGSGVAPSTEPMRRISALYPGTYCTVADMARTWPRCGHSEVVLKREDAAILGKEVELAGSICWRSTDVRNQLRTDAVSPSCEGATRLAIDATSRGLVDSSLGPRLIARHQPRACDLRGHVARGPA